MKRIFKYQLKVLGESIVFLPKGYKILSLSTQDDVITFWAAVDPYATKVERRIFIYRTGHAAVEFNNLTFMGTVQMDNGLVWHVFIEE